MDTSNLVNMNGMFQNFKSLTSIDVSNFNTSKVEYMNNLFYMCYSLTSINLSNFDMRKLKTFPYSIISDCYKLIYIDISSFTNELRVDIRSSNGIIKINKTLYEYYKKILPRNWTIIY